VASFCWHHPSSGDAQPAQEDYPEIDIVLLLIDCFHHPIDFSFTASASMMGRRVPKPPERLELTWASSKAAALGRGNMGGIGARRDVSHHGKACNPSSSSLSSSSSCSEKQLTAAKGGEAEEQEDEKRGKEI
jgi:hypothetical protein